jgi:hypothetical protein
VAVRKESASGKRPLVGFRSSTKSLPRIPHGQNWPVFPLSLYPRGNGVWGFYSLRREKRVYFRTAFFAQSSCKPTSCRNNLEIPLSQSASNWVSRAHVRFWHDADVPKRPINVCFLRKSRHHNEKGALPLLTQSGHCECQIIAVALSYRGDGVCARDARMEDPASPGSHCCEASALAWTCVAC